MRICKHTKLCGDGGGGGSVLFGLDDNFQTHVYSQLNQSPWDVIPFSSNSSLQSIPYARIGRKFPSFCHGKSHKKWLSALSLQILLSAAVPKEESELIRQRASACVICHDKKREISFGCGHTACEDCASRISMYHVCREPITIYRRLF